MIKTVIRIKNDMVLVFDENGDEIPYYQGHYDEVKERIMTDAPKGSIFNHWFGNSLMPSVVNQEDW